ncbi:hypothetical protein [Clostridium paraputrificum]|uniref:hypothetical protein n=1 Tax=Clostridium paraputrificum TaxID=29363 RepID=UPI002FCDD35B
MNPQQIINKMNECLMAMQKGNIQYKSLGLKKAVAEEKYRVALQKEMARLKLEGYRVTIIPDMARGNEEVARLRLERDIAEVNYTVCRDSLRYNERELDILRSQLAWLKVEFKNS